MTTLRSALFEHLHDQKRVDDYYLPVADWVLHKIATNAKRAFFLGISGPQGSGKSTLAESLALLAEHPDARLIAGGTDLAVESNLRLRRFPYLDRKSTRLNSSH